MVKGQRRDREPKLKASGVFQKRKPPLESQIQKLVLEYLKLRGVFSWRNHTQAIIRGGGPEGIRFSKNPNKGAPDILGILPGGLFLGIELKRPGRNPEPEQEAWRERICAAGGVHVLARSVEDVATALMRYLGPESFLGRPVQF